MSERPPVPPPPPDEPSPRASASGGSPTAAAGVPVPGIVGPPPGTVSVPGVVDPARLARRARAAAALERTPAERLESARRDGRTRQGSLLVMAPIRAGQEPALEALLRRIAEPAGEEDLELNRYIPFLQLRTVHFARVLIHRASPSREAPIPEWNGVPQAHGPAIPAKLLLATDFDGSLDAHLAELHAVAGEGLDAIFRHCEGWPGHRSPDDVRDYLLRHRVRTSAFYTGTMGRSVDQIRREAELRERVEAYLDEASREPDFPTDALEIRERIRSWVFGQESLAWARVEPGPLPKLLLPRWLIDRLPLTAGLALLVVLAAAVGALSLFLPPMRALGLVLAGALVLAAVGGIGYLYLRRLAATDPVIIPPRVHEHTARLVQTEDRIVQNEMSSVIYIKEPLWFRRTVLRAVLGYINFAARYLSNQGSLAGIPTIHFARWVMVDDDRRLVFFSNFDGSWENYLGDFIDKAHTGLTAVWSNCVGFPRTRGLSGEGASDEQKFKAYSRASQIPTQVWYSAYRWLTVDNINNNSRIRLGLHGSMSRADAEAWLRRF